MLLTCAQASFPLIDVERQRVKIPFMLPWQPFKFSALNKNHKKHTGLFNEHFYKESRKYPITSFFNLSLREL